MNPKIVVTTVVVLAGAVLLTVRKIKAVRQDVINLGRFLDEDLKLPEEPYRYPPVTVVVEDTEATMSSAELADKLRGMEGPKVITWSTAEDIEVVDTMDWRELPKIMSIPPEETETTLYEQIFGAPHPAPRHRDLGDY